MVMVPEGGRGLWHWVHTIPVIVWNAVLGTSSLPYTITEVNSTIAKAAFLQKFELRPNIVR